MGHMHPMCAGAHSTGVRLLIATALIGNIHDALNRVASGSTQQAVEEPKAPAVPIKKSVQPDYIVCLDDCHSTKCNVGKTRGGQAGLKRVRTRSGRYGMAGWSGTASLVPR